MVAVNAAITLERPLLIKGEPGTGKTVLAHEVAKALEKPLIEWHIKSTTKAQQGLYEYDAVSRLRDSQLGDEKVHDITNYINKGKLWEAFTAEELPVLLIDEIDKADIEFPNDLLLELDQMAFHVYETGETTDDLAQPVTIDLTRYFRRPGLAITSAVETTLTANAAPAERLTWKTEVAAEDGAFTARTPFAYPSLTLRPMEVRTFLARFR